MDFETLLNGSARAHGHLCPGQVIGVRMALLGLELTGLNPIKNPKDIKKLIVFVEMDRCAADAISFVTGATLGRRSLKFKDYGIMAATFVNLATTAAFRIVSTETARALAPEYAPDLSDPHTQQLEAYKIMPLALLFDVFQVEAGLDDTDLPGPTREKIACAECGIIIRDSRQIISGTRHLCHECAGQAYYKKTARVNLSEGGGVIPTQDQDGDAGAH